MAPPPGAPLIRAPEAALSEASWRELLQAVEQRAAAEARQKPLLWTAGVVLPLLLFYSWWTRTLPHTPNPHPKPKPNPNPNPNRIPNPNPNRNQAAGCASGARRSAWRRSCRRRTPPPR